MALDNPKFTESYERVFGNDAGLSAAGDAFFDCFYSNFLRDPEVARLFVDTNMTQQARMLKKSFFALVTFGMLNEPTPELERLGDLHARLGVTDRLFDRWLEALLDTVQASDPQFDETTRLAWCWALAPGMSYIKTRLRDSPLHVPPVASGDRLG